MDLIEEVWNRISSAEWVANVGIPALFTLVAIGLAWWSVRQQLEHDRDLARAEREHSQNQRRAVSADEAAAIIDEAISRIGSASEGNDDPAWWNRPKWSDYAELKRRSDALFKVFLSTVRKPEDAEWWDEVASNHNMLLGRLSVMQMEWSTLVDIQEQEVRYKPDNMDSETWREAMKDLRMFCMRRRAVPLDHFAQDLREWRGDCPMPYRMHPAVASTMLYRDAFDDARQMVWRDMAELTSAVMRNVRGNGEEDEVPGQPSITYKIQLDASLWGDQSRDGENGVGRMRNKWANSKNTVRKLLHRRT